MERILAAIEAIRKKPESTRWTIIGLVTIVLSISLLFVWGWSLSRQFGSLDGDRKIRAELASPVVTIKETWEALKKGEDIEPIVEEAMRVEESPDKEGGIGNKVRSGFAALYEAIGLNAKLILEAFRDIF